jgi:hypothetical protein
VSSNGACSITDREEGIDLSFRGAAAG